MSAEETLRLLLNGHRPVAGVLQNCRLHTAGDVFYGEEGVLERCRLDPHDLTKAEVAAAPGHLALFGEEAAVAADLHGPHADRIWLLARVKQTQPEPRVAVAFDPDLAQARGDVLADPADHPALDTAAYGPLLAAARDLVAEMAGEAPPAYRVRGFLIRAWSASARSVGLLALYRLGPGPKREAGWSHALLLLDGGLARAWREQVEDLSPISWRASL